MNPLPPNADELVSAYLDGEAAPDEIVIVESNAELMARVASMRALSGRLGAPTVAPPEQKEAHIAAALGAFDTMFAATEVPNTDAAAAPAPPRLTAVPTPTQPAHAAPPATTITSLDAARDRRKPRRFNVGLIAAALTALLLMVGLTVLSRGGNDVANSALQEGISDADTAAASADFGSDAMADDEAASDDEPSLDAQAQVPGGLSESQEARSTAAPEPTFAPPPAQAAPEVDADTESATESGDSAASDDAEEAMDDAEEEFASEGADIEPEAILFSLGRFRDIEEFTSVVDRLGVDGLLETARQQEPDQPFPCQAEISELVDDESVEVVAEALIDNSETTTGMVQVYVVQATTDGAASIYVVDPADCSILSVTPDG